MKYIAPKKRRVFFSAPYDWNLIICVILLNIFGLIMIYSASYYYAEHSLGYAPNHFFKNQLYFVLAGIVLMFFVSRIGPHFYNNWFFLAAAVFMSLILIVAVAIPSISKSSHGAARWIKIGSFTLQIAEPVKLFLIVFSACWIARIFFRTEGEKSIAYFLIFAGISLLLLFLSNNMSTALIVLLNAYLLMMINSKSMKTYVILMILAVLAGIAAIFLLENVIPYSPEENFRFTRIRAWLHPTDPDFSADEAYQGTLALYAIASGGFFGKGLGRSLIKFRLPEPHNDYILAIIFEELGVFGVIILTILFGYLLYRIFIVYRDSKNRFSRNIVLGVFLHLALQVLMNYGVTLGLLPTMGVTLTFISAGGTSVLFTFIEIGLVLACARETAWEKAHEKALSDVSGDDPAVREMLEKHDKDFFANLRLPGILRKKQTER